MSMRMHHYRYEYYPHTYVLICAALLGGHTPVCGESMYYYCYYLSTSNH